MSMEVPVGLLLPEEPVIKCGILTKQGGNFKTWKRRWFVLQGHQLFYYRSEKETAPGLELGIIDLDECEKMITSTVRSHGFEIHTPNRIFRIVAQDGDFKDAWCQAVGPLIGGPKVVTSDSSSNSAPSCASIPVVSPVPVEEDATAVQVSARATRAFMTETNSISFALRGWLQKRGPTKKALWRSRWFVLRDGKLVYYKSDKEESVLGTVLLPMAKGIISEPDSLEGKDYTFHLVTPTRTLVMSASSNEDKTAWITALNRAGVENITSVHKKKDDNLSLISDNAIAPSLVESDSDDLSDMDGMKEESILQTSTGGLADEKRANSSVVKCGYLTKVGGAVKSWKRRWFVLHDDIARLSYYKGKKEKRAVGVIDLACVTGIVKAASTSPKPNSFFLKTARRIYVINAASSEESNEWIAALEAAIPEYVVNEGLLLASEDGDECADDLLNLVNMMDAKLHTANERIRDLEAERKSFRGCSTDARDISLLQPSIVKE